MSYIDGNTEPLFGGEYHITSSFTSEVGILIIGPLPPPIFILPGRIFFFFGFRLKQLHPHNLLILHIKFYIVRTKRQNNILTCIELIDRFNFALMIKSYNYRHVKILVRIYLVLKIFKLIFFLSLIPRIHSATLLFPANFSTFSSYLPEIVIKSLNYNIVNIRFLCPFFRLRISRLWYSSSSGHCFYVAMFVVFGIIVILL